MINLESVSLVYNITALPTILFAQITKASEPLTFKPDKFHIPTELKGQPVELRVSAYDKSGRCLNISSDMLPASASIICQTAEYTGLKMVESLLG
jgi:hypothetical protein